MEGLDNKWGLSLNRTSYVNSYQNDDYLFVAGLLQKTEHGGKTAIGLFPGSGRRNKKRNRKTVIADIVHIKQGIFESDEHFEKRSKREAYAAIAGVTQRFLESEKDFERRAKLEALKTNSQLVHILELDKDE